MVINYVTRDNIHKFCYGYLKCTQEQGIKRIGYASIVCGAFAVRGALLNNYVGPDENLKTLSDVSFILTVTGLAAMLLIETIFPKDE